jgi:hypothetical protein
MRRRGRDGRVQTTAIICAASSPSLAVVLPEGPVVSRDPRLEAADGWAALYRYLERVQDELVMKSRHALAMESRLRQAAREERVSAVEVRQLQEAADRELVRRGKGRAA